MEKMKLTQAQIDAINKALSHYGDADYLVKMHRQVVLNGHEWSIWSELNDLSPAVLNHALKYGFVITENTTPQQDIDKPLVQKSSRQELELDLDYELASLHDAMQQGNQAEVECCKKRLAEINKELEGETNAI